MVSEYMLHDKKLDRNYIDNFKIYEINITEMAKLCYNGEKKKGLKRKLLKWLKRCLKKRLILTLYQEFWG